MCVPMVIDNYIDIPIYQQLFNVEDNLLILIQDKTTENKFDIVKLSEIEDETILDHLKSFFIKNDLKFYEKETVIIKFENDYISINVTSMYTLVDIEMYAGQVEFCAL